MTKEPTTNRVVNPNYYDPNNNINHVSHLHGGTFITNFSFNRLEKYKESVKWFNQKHGSNILQISAFAYSQDDRPVQNSLSLHKTDAVDLSEFWRYYESI